MLWLLSTNPLWIFNKFESSVFEIKCLTLFSKKVSRNSLYIHFNSQILLTHISKVVNNNVVMMVKRNISKEKMWLIEFIKSVMFAIVFAIASGHYLRCDLVVCFCSIFNSWQPCSHIDGFQHQNVHFDCFYLAKRSQFWLFFLYICYQWIYRMSWNLETINFCHVRYNWILLTLTCHHLIHFLSIYGSINRMVFYMKK